MLIRRAGTHLVIPLIFGIVIYPATGRPGENLDPSWFGVVAAVLLLGGYIVIGLAVGTWMMVLQPLIVLTLAILVLAMRRLSPDHRGCSVPGSSLYR